MRSETFVHSNVYSVIIYCFSALKIIPDNSKLTQFCNKSVYCARLNFQWETLGFIFFLQFSKYHFISFKNTSKWVIKEILKDICHFLYWYQSTITMRWTDTTGGRTLHYALFTNFIQEESRIQFHLFMLQFVINYDFN